MTRLIIHTVSAALFLCFLVGLAVGLVVYPPFGLASMSWRLGRGGSAR